MTNPIFYIYIKYYVTLIHVLKTVMIQTRVNGAVWATKTMYMRSNFKGSTRFLDDGIQSQVACSPSFKILYIVSLNASLTVVLSILRAKSLTDFSINTILTVIVEHRLLNGKLCRLNIWWCLYLTNTMDDVEDSS